MNGLELSKEYYEQFGKPMLEQEFSDILDLLAVGFVGSGSDRYGFDDETSQDHDFEPGFCIFIPDEDVLDSKKSFQLERAYAKLPKEFKGYKRQMMSPVGGNRNGVITISDFYQRAVGDPKGELSEDAWLHIPDYALAEATNGEIFFDNYGVFSSIRQKLLEMPRDIRLKRLAGNVLLMAQSGQYNYQRCMKHGEPEAAQMACIEFANACMKSYFLLKNQYMPYYKWAFRAFKNLEGCSDIASHLSFIINNGNDEDTAPIKYDSIEHIASELINELQDQEITKAICGDLEKHAYSINDFIEDGNIRNMNVFAGI